MSATGTKMEDPHLLVVDDDERLRDLLQRYLSTNGFRVSAAGDAQVQSALAGVLDGMGSYQDLAGRAMELNDRARAAAGRPDPTALAEYRREGLATGAVAANALRQLAGLPYFGRNLMIKIALVARAPWLARLVGHRGTDWPY